MGLLDLFHSHAHKYETNSPRMSANGITIAILQKTDAPQLQEMLTGDVMMYLDERVAYPFTERDARRTVHTVRDMYKHGDYSVLGIRDTETNALMGVMGVAPVGSPEGVHRCTAEVGIWIGQKYWKKGIATAASSMGLNLIYQMRPWLLRLEAKVMEPNVASAKLMEKIGFTLESRMRDAVIPRNSDTPCNLLLFVFFFGKHPHQESSGVANVDTATETDDNLSVPSHCDCAVNTVERRQVLVAAKKRVTPYGLIYCD